MNENKEKSAVGMGVPATEIEKSSDNIISDSDGKIKSFENINRILGKLTEVLQLTDKCCDVIEIKKIGDNAVVCHINGSIECINISGDSGIVAIYDIVEKLVF